jgi:hypothetical protein
VGKYGPNAAGRARKAVVLSCVKVITAFGGKREKGARKAKNAWIPVFGVTGAVVVIVCGGCEDRKERNVKNTVVRKKATAMMILGGRML